jgi:ribonuclease HI
MHDGTDMTEQKPREITVTFKGSCQGNPGPGSWKAHLWEPATRKQDTLRGEVRDTTNIRMELTAALEGVLRVTAGANVTMVGSQYVVQGMNEWVAKWQANGWRAASRKRVEHRELWEAINAAVKRHRKVTWRRA